jgi:hypothetical protein
MKYIKRVSKVDVLGNLWMGGKAAYTYNLTDSDLRNIGEYSRDNVAYWLSTHSGDFQGIDDFRCTISDSSGMDFDCNFQDENSEVIFNDCMFPCECEVE